jgi:alginate O-acetyltransferase complex protein AlgI
MVFSDPVFLAVFLPCCLAAFWAGAWRFRNPFLCVVGGIFYVWGGGAFVLLLIASIVANHTAARRIARLRETDRTQGRWVVRAVVSFDLGALALWKYGGFVIHQLAPVARAGGLKSWPTLHLSLPIAISFYTFQCISYVIDTWRGTADPAPHLVDFAAYILLFPHLIAGPVVRYAHIEHDLLHQTRHRVDDFALGAPRFFWGLAKKVVIADQVAAIANRVFGLPNERMTAGVAWVGVLAYAVQIYFDFSGYSDMAIGLARIFGFSFPENFDRPYSARSVTDFWRRWHISLSSWFRDYVYIPLGGNRKSPLRTYLNLGCIFLLTGLWHGANWTFVAWGLFHGALLIIERGTGLGTSTSQGFLWFRRLLTFALICVGWAIFRAANIAQAWAVVHAMLTPSGLGIPVSVREVISIQRITWFAVGLLVVVLPANVRMGQRVSAVTGRSGDVFRLVVMLSVAPISFLYALSSSFSPFLYFKF